MPRAGEEEAAGLAVSPAFCVGGEGEAAGLPESAAFFCAGGEEEAAGLLESVAHFCARGGREAAGTLELASTFCGKNRVAPAVGFLALAASGAGARLDEPLAPGAFTEGRAGKTGPVGKGGADGEGAAGTSTVPLSEGGSRPAAAAALAVINHRCNSMLVMGLPAWPGPRPPALPARA